MDGVTAIDMDLVTVIIPVYNVELYLRNCLESVINQSYKNIEIILIDDGSYDKSGDILDEYAQIDTRIKVIHKSNGGVSEARNIGIEFANGKYICFIDSDDTVDLSYISELVNPMSNKDCDLVICNMNDIYMDHSSKREVSYELNGNFNEDYYGLYSLTRVPVIKLYKTEIIKSKQIFFPVNISYLEDQIFNFRYFEHVKEYCFVNKALYNYYHRNNSSLSQKITQNTFEGNVIKLGYARNFYRRKCIREAGRLLNQQVLFCIDKFVKLSDRSDNYYFFKKRVNLLLEYVDFNEETNSVKRKIVLFLLRYNIILPFYIKALIKRYIKNK